MQKLTKGEKKMPTTVMVYWHFYRYFKDLLA
jgi:hypothetical protein